MLRQGAHMDLPGDSVTTSRVASSIVDLLTAALEMGLACPDSPCSRHLELLRRAKDFMLARLDDTELDIDDVADHLCVSQRTLNRVFAADGTTAIRWLWQQRLESSHRTLSEGRVRHVTDVALQSGFSDFSHFSRSFKRAYGVAPHKLLRNG